MRLTFAAQSAPRNHPLNSPVKIDIGNARREKKRPRSVAAFFVN